jgi:hypothetical protein
MQFYSNAEELITDAVKQGFIRLSRVTINLNGASIETPNAILVVNANKWKLFLQNIIENTDSEEEAKFAQKFLTPLSNNIPLSRVSLQELQNVLPEQKQQPPIVSSSKLAQKSDISDSDFILLTKEIESCNTIDDIIALMNERIPTKILWKRPVRDSSGKLRYFCHNTKWYVELQEYRRDMCYYSIFNSEKKEVARYDTLKDAKNSMLSVIKYFTKT